MNISASAGTRSILKLNRNVYRAVVWVVLALVLWSGGKSCSAKITRGAVLLRLEQTRAAVMWETDTRGAGQVRYGAGEELTDRMRSEPVRVSYRHATANRSVYIHKVWLDDLKAQTRYGYVIVSGREESDTCHFKTIPQDARRVRFVVYGDSRKNSRTHRRVVEQIIKVAPDFVVHTGDFVNAGSRYQEWGPQFFGPLRGLAEYVPIYAAKGNHDRGSFFDRYFVIDGRRNYSFTYGPLYYFIGDNATGNLATAGILKILAADSAKDDAVWRFVTWHEPNLNIGGHQSRRGCPGALPKLSAEGVDFVVTGHSHFYERFRPVTASAKDAAPVTCITAGGGAADLSDVQPDFLLAEAKKENHFCLFEIDGARLSMKTINIDGKVIDRIDLTRTDGRLDESYVSAAVSTQAVTFHQEVVEELTAYTHSRPKKDKTFEATLKISPITMDKDMRLVCEPECSDGAYEHSGPQEVIAKPKGGDIKLRFRVKPLVDVSLTYKKHFDPPLYIHCEYETAHGRAWTDVPVEYN